MSDLKKCVRCEAEFPATADFFYRRSDSPDGLTYYCKTCAKWYTNRWRAKSADKTAAYREKNREHINAVKRKYYANLPTEKKDKIVKRIVAWKKKHPDKVVKWNRKTNALKCGYWFKGRYAKRKQKLNKGALVALDEMNKNRLARETGINRTTIYYWQKRKIILFENAVKLADYMHLPVDVILEEVEYYEYE